jgi:hypothetical protein
MPHKKANSKKDMPQNKTVTQINSSGGGTGRYYEVTTHHEKDLNRATCSPVPGGRQKRKTPMLNEFIRQTEYNRKYARIY